jgi:adhesin transport system membrane fusion protein
MTATVEIKTGRKTVLNYLVKPIFKTFGEALGER